MSNLIRMPQRPLQKSIKNVISNSLQIKEQVKAQKETIILADVSGSMGEDEKWSALLGALADFPSITKLFFSSDVTDKQPPHPGGGTALHLGFEHLRQGGHKKIILVSDGLPDDQERALVTAINLRLPVHIIFVGDNPAGRRFMETLAAATKGSAAVVEKPCRDKLQATIKSLLLA